MANPNITNKISLPEEEINKENMLCYIVERQFSNPSEVNKASLINALKDGSVYVPVTFHMTESQKQEIAKAAMEGRQPEADQNTSFVPQYLIHRKTGEKCLPFFTREDEFNKSANAQKVSFIRIPAAKMIEISDNIPDAFDILIDAYTHPVKFTLDELIEGFKGTGSTNVINDNY